MYNIKVRNNVELEDLLKNFKNNETSYDIDDSFDEFVSISKETRIISHYGYTGLLMDWLEAGLITTDDVEE